MIQTGDFKFIRSLNGQLVLNLVRKHGIISSSELVNITGLRPSTIFNILKELSEKSLVLNLGKGESTEKGGKKPFLWQLNNDAAVVIGIDIEINQITAVVLDLNGNLLIDEVAKFEKLKSVDELIKIISSKVDVILERFKIDPYKIIGMGIALPGIVNSEDGIIMRTDIISDKNIPLADELTKIYSFPILIENNANATAMGAKWVGAAKGCKNFLVVLAEFDKAVGGMGIGIVIDEHIYYGHCYCSGELNMPIMNLEQMMIYIRAELSESELLRKYDSHPDELDTDILIDAAKKGDQLAISFFKRLGNQIGESISYAVSLLNPEALIVSGTIADLDDIITEPIKDVLERKTLPFISSCINIRTSIHGSKAVAIGAASLILNDFFKIPIIKRNGLKEQINVFSE